MLIDKEAQQSRLSRMSPALKIFVSLYCTVNCIAADNIITSLLTLFTMSFIICVCGGLKFKRLLRFYCIPLFFAAVGAAALAFEADAAGSVLSLMGISVTRSGLFRAAEVFLRCMGAVSAVYFLSLTTPVTAMFSVIRRTPLPDFITETAELVYRYIFVLYDSYKKINVAQESRLGYNTLRAKYRSTALVGGAVFIKAMDQARRSYTAMESRGYTGSIKTLTEKYAFRKSHAVYLIIMCMFLTASGVIT